MRHHPEALVSCQLRGAGLTPRVACVQLCGHATARLFALRRNRSDIKPSVGTAGFEPAALCSQSSCATRLRHAPTQDSSLLMEGYLLCRNGRARTGDLLFPKQARYQAALRPDKASNPRVAVEGVFLHLLLSLRDGVKPLERGRRQHLVAGLNCRTCASRTSGTTLAPQCENRPC